MTLEEFARAVDQSQPYHALPVDYLLQCLAANRQQQEAAKRGRK